MYAPNTSSMGRWDMRSIHKRVWAGLKTGFLPLDWLPNEAKKKKKKKTKKQILLFTPS